MEDCIFCKIIKGEIPCKKEFEDEDVLVFHDTYPLAPVHLLVVPKKHISKLSDATADDQMLLGKIQLVAAKVAKDLGIGEAFRVLNANGTLAGQTVFHIHYHVRGGWGDKAPEDI
jgi:histidine triad (HIT) family protein